jgi:hypothetical protein
MKYRAMAATSVWRVENQPDPIQRLLRRVNRRLTGPNPAIYHYDPTVGDLRTYFW